MADSITTHITGLEELKQTLAQLPEEMVERIVRKALGAGITVLGKAIQGNTPVETGELRNSVGISVKVSHKEQGGAAVVGFGDQGYVARFIEFGHAIVTHKPEKKEVGHVAANPFIRRSFDASKEQAVEAFVETVKASLPELKKK